jgi:hypothetical protein
MLCESVDGATNARRSTVQDMGVYHRGLYLARAQEFLDRSDIVIAFVEPRRRLSWGQAQRRLTICAGGAHDDA